MIISSSQWKVSVVSIFSVVQRKVIPTHEEPVFWRLQENKNCVFHLKLYVRPIMGKAILNTKEYANVNQSNYFDMSEKMLRILEL